MVGGGTIWMAVAAAGWTAAGSVPSEPLAASLAPSVLPAAPGRLPDLVLSVAPAPGWHGYWRDPGVDGVAPRFEWRAPAGVAVGPGRWPEPSSSSVVDGVAVRTMDAPWTISFPVRAARALAPGARVPVRLQGTMFACSAGMCASRRVDATVVLVAGGAAPRSWPAAIASCAVAAVAALAARLPSASGVARPDRGC